MRPLQLEFSAFGSFPGVEAVDFTALEPRGLFVVTGNTGTGKTTILDAICFALYGKMPGKPADDIRSHHAQADIKTYVRLRFEVDKEVYLVERSPAYPRPKQRGHGTTDEKAQASLVRLNPDGSTTSIETKFKEVGQQCERLIGLNAEQFQKVLLLPQGDFQKFLLDNSAGREEILSKLFDGALYQRIVVELFNRSQSLQRDLTTAESEFAIHLDNAREEMRTLFNSLELEWKDDLLDLSHHQLGDLLNSAEGSVLDLHSKTKNAEDEAAAAATAADKADILAGQFDSAARLKTTIEELESSKVQVQANLDRAHSSRKAGSFVEAWNARANAQANHETAEKALRSRLGLIVESAKCFPTDLDISSAQSIVETVAKFRKLAEDGGRLIDELEEAGRVLAKLDQDVETFIEERSKLDGQKRQAEDRLGEIGVRPAAEALNAELASIKGAIENHPELVNLEDQVRVMEGELSEAAARFETTLERFLETEAPRLAQRLREGDPCPVCGSTSHPLPAQAGGTEIVDYEMVGEAKGVVDGLTSKLESLKRRRQDLLDSMGSLRDHSLQDLEQRKHDIGIDLELTEEIAGLDEMITTTALKLSEIDGRQVTFAQSREKLVDKLAEAETAASAIDRVLLSQYSTALEDIAPLMEGLTELFSTELTTRTAFEQSKAEFLRAESESGFTDIDEARRMIVTPSEEEEWIEAEERHRNDLNGAKIALTELERSGIPEQRPDLDEAERSRKATKLIADQLQGKLTIVEDLQRRLGGAISELGEFLLATDDLRASADLARRAYKVCNGQGPEKVNLPRWILGRELDRIVAAATVRLQKMTNSRYSLQRKRSNDDKRVATGLDIEVFDSHTGRTRGPNSLSGGEQFQASLALALGLADVVSRGGTGSGKRPQALFIDEGFGSLDPTALDDVIDTLQQLQATGRLVGAITHVPEMKERLHQGIIVMERPDGRGSTLQVHS